MKQEIITCDVCGRGINIPNEEESVATATALNGEITTFSNWPSFLRLSIFGYGELYSNIRTEMDICQDCIADKFVIKIGKICGRICFTTGEQADSYTAETYSK